MTLKDQNHRRHEGRHAREGHARACGTMRLLLAAMKQREVDERIELTDADVLAIIDKMIKQRRESIAQFEEGRRARTWPTNEKAEIAVLRPTCRSSCPTPKSRPLIAATSRRPAPKAPTDMGKVMGVLKPSSPAAPTWARSRPW